MSELNSHKILFVDDESHWREAATASLTKAGFDVLTAADGSQAISQAASGPLALMIVDEDLGGESGTMLAKFLRHNNPDVPTILHTRTEYEPEAALDMMNRCAVQCLPKGSVEELLVNVGCYLR